MDMEYSQRPGTASLHQSHERTWQIDLSVYYCRESGYDELEDELEVKIGASPDE
jgi:hypothetical protein